MQLGGNPFKHNCLFLLFLIILNTSAIASDIHPYSEPNFDVKASKHSNSQDWCSYYCTGDEYVTYMFVDCSSQNLVVAPEFFVNNITEIEVSYAFWLPLIQHENWKSYTGLNSVYSVFRIKDEVLGINLANNSLESLETAQFPPNLIELYLSDNKLRRLPESVFENQRNLKKVTLSGNPWKCDCDTVNFKRWLTSEKHKIKDIDNVRCGITEEEASHLKGRVIWNLTALDLCPTRVALYVSTSSGALIFLIVCLASKVLYTKYRLNIKVFLYSHHFTFIKEDDFDYDKVFDVFVSFSHEDDEFVIKDIISVIEKKDPNICLCLHYRHFLAGDLIQRNITRAVQNSKKTLVILSRSFIESEWCILEFKTAHAQVMTDKLHRIIVIKLGDLPKEIDPLIKVYLDSTTYLTWGENNFWNKLFYVLPNQCSVRNPIPNNMEETAV